VTRLNGLLLLQLFSAFPFPLSGSCSSSLAGSLLGDHLLHVDVVHRLAQVVLAALVQQLQQPRVHQVHMVEGQLHGEAQVHIRAELCLEDLLPGQVPLAVEEAEQRAQHSVVVGMHGLVEFDCQ
jgi:hypothetical protein